MKYIIKNKILSLGGSSSVKDEEGNDLFYVKGKIFSLRRIKTIQDLNGQVLFKVRNKLISFFFPKVHLLDAEGNEILLLKKRDLFGLRQDFELVTVNCEGHNYSIQGDYIGRNYSICDNGIPVAHIRRNFNLAVDSFWLETEMTENAALYVAIVIALDNYGDKRQKDLD